MFSSKHTIHRSMANILLYCLIERLSSIRVLVSNSTENWADAPECYRFGKLKIVTTSHTIWYRRLCETPLVGRFVIVEKTSCEYSPKDATLTLCEVVVIDNLYLGGELISSKRPASLQGYNILPIHLVTGISICYFFMQT